MYVQLDCICLFIYLFQLISVAAKTITIGHFKASKRSSKIKQCAIRSLKKEGISGLRLSERTDECEVMVESWDEQMIKPGQEYAKLVAKKWIYQPAVEVQLHRPFTLLTPGNFKKMTRMDMNLTFPKELLTWKIGIRIIFIDGGNFDLIGMRHSYTISIYKVGRKIELHDMVKEEDYIIFYEDDLSGTSNQISFDIDEHGNIRLLINGKGLSAVKTGMLTYDIIYGFSIINEEYDDNNVLQVHSFDLKLEKLKP